MLERSLSDILLSLGRASTDAAGWSLFLNQISDQLRADDAFLYFRERDQTRIVTLNKDIARGSFPAHLAGLRFGRVYTTDELADRTAQRLQPGKRGARAMGVQIGTAEIWLHLSHPSQDFRARDSALMSSLLPHLAQTGATFLERERTAQDAARSNAVLRQLSTGWILLDPRGQILAVENVARGLIEAHLGINTGFLQLDADKADLLAQYLAQVLSSELPASRRIILREDPRVELLISHDPVIPNAALGYLRLCDPPLPDADSLADMLGVTPAEARLAHALAAGASIAGAAAQLGLTLETARSYSKKIFAKTGLEGQPALIRHLWSGVALMRN